MRKTKIRKNNKRKNTKLILKKINKCNKVLVKNEKSCQCSNGKGHPTNNINCSRNNNNNCQEYNECRKLYNNFLNGFEPKWRPLYWSDRYINDSHNCYTYFLNDQIEHVKKSCRKKCLEQKKKCPKKGKFNNNRIDNCGDLRPQPGDWAYYKHKIDNKKFKKISDRYTCKDMVYKVNMDNLDSKGKPLIKPIKFEQKCYPNHYKGAIVVDPGDEPEGHTFHFYRQDANGRFSHKPGILKIENMDASGNAIWAPHLADRNYNKKNEKGGINYTNFCGYYCIPTNAFADTNAR